MSNTNFDSYEDDEYLNGNQSYDENGDEIETKCIVPTDIFLKASIREMTINKTKEFINEMNVEIERINKRISDNPNSIDMLANALINAKVCKNNAEMNLQEDELKDKYYKAIFNQHWREGIRAELNK